jgi:hypothetical protein
LVVLLTIDIHSKKDILVIFGIFQNTSKNIDPMISQKKALIAVANSMPLAAGKVSTVGDV